jgi:hypothetical protein
MTMRGKHHRDDAAIVFLDTKTTVFLERKKQPSSSSAVIEDLVNCLKCLNNAELIKQIPHCVRAFKSPAGMTMRGKPCRDDDEGEAVPG